MTPEPQCLCEQCKMTVQQCKERGKHTSPTSAEQVLGEPIFSTTKERLKECHSFSDEDFPYCNDRAELCRFTHRTRCPEYKSVIHHQVECDARQGTFFAQQMVKDAELRTQRGREPE